jgi:anthranilate synthase/aminodeoxychorismate synthase-like glutamine amidotransferase
MILLIDNYDSFVYNLARYVGRAGHARTVVRNDAITLDDIAAMAPTHIVLSPGPGVPEDAGICVALIKRFAGTTPILGICLGHQAIASAFGGTITHAKVPMHGKASVVSHTESSILSGIKIPLEVGRYHSLIVAEPLPACLRATAHSQEGELMALEHIEHPVFGVQFHPESILTKQGEKVVENFCGINR